MAIHIPGLAELVFGGGVKLGDKPLILFSGEGESLIMAWLAARYRLPVQALHVVTEYGRFWCLDRVAYARWRKLQSVRPLYVHILPAQTDTTKHEPDNRVSLFSHTFVITPTYKQPFFYTTKDSIANAIARLRPTSVLMGIREDDLYRHLVYRAALCQPSEIDQITAWLRPQLEKGQPVPTDRPWPENLPLYWPLFTLSTAHKDALLEHITPNLDDYIAPAPTLDASVSFR